MEVGIIGNATEYGGDLSKTPFIVEEANIGGSIFGKKYFTNHLSANLGLSFGKLSGTDANVNATRSRNLSFRSQLFEVAATAHYDLFDLNTNSFTPFGYAGIAVFRHNPEAELDGKWIALQPLGTEGQGIDGFEDPYNLLQLAIPLGGGVKFRLGEDFIALLDLSARKTFTDHLDDVGAERYVAPEVFSTAYQTSDPGRLARLLELAYRADELNGGRPYTDLNDPAVRSRVLRSPSEKNDWYYFGGVGLSFILFNEDRSSNPIRQNRKKVPYEHKYPNR